MSMNRAPPFFKAVVFTNKQFSNSLSTHPLSAIAPHDISAARLVKLEFLIPVLF